MLTDTSIRAAVRDAVAAGKPIKRTDGRGLYILAKPNGAALWRFKYRIDGVEKLIGLGIYNDVTIKRAREKRDAARQLVADQIDPSSKRKAERIAQANSVAAVSREWLDRLQLNPGTIKRDRERIEKFVLPYIGARPIAAVAAPELLPVLARIEARGTLETARRVRALCGRVWRYAVATGRAAQDITISLKGALRTPTVKNHAAIVDPKKVGELLRSLHAYQGQPTTEAALKLAPLLALRPGELRQGEWSEIDFDKAEWRVPASKMKMGEQHVVPLSTQAVAILRGIEQHTGDGKYIFPSLRSGGRPMSANCVLGALRRLGYGIDQQSGHGFRSIFSTLANELGWHPDLIELQLAHAERNKVRGAYNKAQRLDERRKMMQAWSDHLDKLRAGVATTRNE